MLKGLLTRQIFMFLDVALAVLTVFLAYQVFTKLFQPPAGAVVAEAPGAEAALPTLPTVGPRTAYDVIVASRLFGEAGEKRVEAAPPPPSQEDVASLPETSLNLKLKGTSFTTKRPNALIEQQGVGVDVYEPGDDIVEGQVQLAEVHNRWVVLMNASVNRREVLRMDEEVETTAPDPKPTLRGPAPGSGDAGRNTATIKRDELQQELEAVTENLAEIVNTVNPHPVQDANGNVVGFTADNLDQLPLAKRLGFRNGDVVKEINGQPIDSMESITSVIEKYQNASNFHVTVLRNGTPTLLRFKLE